MNGTDNDSHKSGEEGREAMEPTLTLTREEKFLMMLYCPGSRQGLERELERMRKEPE